MSFVEELLKTKSIMRLMKDKVNKGDADVDIVEYSLATKMLENKLSILQSLNINVESEDNNKIVLNVHGSGKSVEIDLVKLREAITIHDKRVEETEVVRDDQPLKIFKYTGDFAKIKSRDIKAKAQEKRAAEFGKDPKKYLDALKQTVAEEELAYEKSS